MQKTRFETTSSRRARGGSSPFRLPTPSPTGSVAFSLQIHAAVGAAALVRAADLTRGPGRRNGGFPHCASVNPDTPSRVASAALLHTFQSRQPFTRVSGIARCVQGLFTRVHAGVGRRSVDQPPGSPYDAAPLVSIGGCVGSDVHALNEATTVKKQPRAESSGLHRPTRSLAPGPAKGPIYGVKACASAPGLRGPRGAGRAPRRGRASRGRCANSPAP